MKPARLFLTVAIVCLTFVSIGVASVNDQELLNFLGLNSSDQSVRDNALDLKVDNNIRFRDIAQVQYDLWRAIQDNKKSLTFVDATAMFKAVDEVVEEIGSELIGWVAGSM